MRSLLLLLFSCTVMTQAQMNVDDLTGLAANPANKLEQLTQLALDKITAAAAKEGIKIQLVSGYRSFARQRSIWNRKYKRYQSQGLEPDAIFDKIVEYSTVPGTSRHHWGTDVDLIDGNATYSGDVLVPDKFHGDGPFCEFKDWMEAHASDYGFELVYTNAGNRSGFKYEPWHYSYAPVSKDYLEIYNEKMEFVTFLRSQDIMGMNDISDDRLLRYFKEHINGVNPSLKTTTTKRKE
ncbi:M15 family metallopeptidase [Nonlabens ponticola]|uniref:D-alanyl-D-alanine carboxypeptidase family protein n=1 Tax=Nonlabens ponticola TaxID=2496866 RepID=A0A3S9MUK7_9FLAO|nr:M15 family metallopeptidase [Nonlabens ponticola]AZQ42864.1 D-alanyl-D-alanine carboxypeptidase family protein [Nonlabens ponticola]